MVTICIAELLLTRAKTLVTWKSTLYRGLAVESGCVHVLEHIIHMYNYNSCL